MFVETECLFADCFNRQIGKKSVFLVQKIVLFFENGVKTPFALKIESFGISVLEITNVSVRVGRKGIR